MNVMSRIIGIKTPMLRSATIADQSGKKPNVRFVAEKVECAIRARNNLAVADTNPNRMGPASAHGQSEGYPVIRRILEHGPGFAPGSTDLQSVA